MKTFSAFLYRPSVIHTPYFSRAVPLHLREVKSFVDYLNEAKMTMPDALKILELKPGYSQTDVKAAKKRLNVLHHTDRGGDLATVQSINYAADYLMKGNGGSTIYAGASPNYNDPSSRAARQEQEAAYKEKAARYSQITKDTVESEIDLEAFLNHFQTIFGQTFSWSAGFVPDYSGHYVQYNAEFKNVDQSIVTSFHLSIDYSELFQKPVFGNPGAFLKMYLTSEILYKRKKLKLFQANYQFSNALANLKNPTLMFPTAKLKAQMGKSSTRKFAKRDAYLIFQKELNAIVSDEWVYVPIGNYFAAFWRSTMMGLAAWQSHSIQNNRNGRAQNKVAILKYKTFYESEAGMTPLFDLLKDMQRLCKVNPNDWDADYIARKIDALPNSKRSEQADKDDPAKF